MAQKPRKQERKMSTRAIAGMPTTVDADSRSFEIVITTETPVRTWIYDAKLDTGMEVDEVLLASGLDMSRAARMPLMDSHDVYSGIDKILGKVEDLRVEGDKVIGRATLVNGRGELAQNIAEGFYGQVSAGYCGDEYEIEMRDGNVPLAYATKWTLHEASLVPVGADPNASVRGARTFPAPKLSVRNQTQETVMDELETAIVAAEDAIEALDAAVTAAGDTADEALLERARKLRAEGDETLTDEEKKKQEEEAAAAAEAARAARSDDEELTADEQKKEDEEVRSIRSVAATYGLGKTVDDLVKLGARAKAIKASVRAAVLKRGATPAVSTGNLKPQAERSAPVIIDTAAIYAKRNKH